MVHLRSTALLVALAAATVVVLPAVFGGTPAPGRPGADRPWAPPPGAEWQWQLSGTPAAVPGVDVYGMDGQETTAEEVGRFRARGKHTICYLSAGTLEQWRPDASRFPPAVVGRPMAEWEGERWLDVRRLDVLLPIMADRMDDCARKGFDAVEADNVDGHANDTGFPLSPADQLRYNKELARLAHERGLSIALKNDVEQIRELEPHFDFAINEECFRYDECDAYEPFLAKGKAVLNVEYEDTPGRCGRAAELGISSMLKHPELGSWRRPC